MLKLHFLGRGAAFYPVFRNTNAFFEKGKNLFFLDFGESAFAQVAAALPLKEYEKIYVLLTHLHADHSGSLASMTSYLYFVLHKKLTIVHPEDTVVRLLALQGVGAECYEYLPELPQLSPFREQILSCLLPTETQRFLFLAFDTAAFQE